MTVVLHNVAKVHRAAGGAVTALQDISFELASGELLGLLGPSPSGKSTLTNILGCLGRPTSGVYELDGRGLGGLSDNELRAVRNQQIGLVFRSYHLLPRMRVVDEVELPLLYSGRTNPRALALEALGAVGLAECGDQTLADLTPEQAPLVAMARALITNPSLLVFLDDPGFELDVQMLQRVWPYVQELRACRTLTMVVTPHSLDEAAACDRLAVLNGGRLVAFDAPGELGARVGRDRLELRTDDRPALLAQLQAQFGLRPQTGLGTVVVYSAAGHELAERLRGALGGLVRSLRIERTTLEDVLRVYLDAASMGAAPSADT